MPVSNVGQTTVEGANASQSQVQNNTGHVGSLSVSERIHHFAKLEVNNDSSDPINSPAATATKMRYIAENLWRLKRPKVIISITGVPGTP